MVDRGYCRISLDTKVSGSISKQKAQITASVVTKGGDPSAIEWYVDESKSGAIPMRNRPQGGRLWREVSKGDVVHVTKIDRAARSAQDLLRTVEYIEETGASVVFVGNHMDTSGAPGKLMLTVLAGVAEFERALIAERRTESIAAARGEGRHIVGDAPFGFRSVANPEGRGLVIRPDPDTAPLLREAIERVMAGEAQDSVRHMLGLSKTGMHKILRNPRLGGMIPEGTGVVTLDGLPRIDEDAALLTLVEWRALQDYLAKPETKAWSKARGYGAALRCGVCGCRMYLTKSKRSNQATGGTHDTYTCRRDKHQPGESAPTVMAHKADARLEEAFLLNWDGEPELEEIVLDDPAVRTGAIALAQVQLQAAQRALLADMSDEDEERAFQGLREAKKALKAAEGLPVDRATETRATGRTYGQAWADADDDERSYLLVQCLGPATVQVGRLPIEDKVVW